MGFLKLITTFQYILCVIYSHNTGLLNNGGSAAIIQLRTNKQT